MFPIASFQYPMTETAVTVLDLNPNSQTTSAFYLENIYQLQFLADSNLSRQPFPANPLRPPPFSSPNYVIWVNSLWFLCLAISLTYVMLATLVQQWARRYLRITRRPRHSPHDGFRIRAFFSHGVDDLGVSRVVEDTYRRRLISISSCSLRAFSFISSM
jgi:Family of unknown function (DUF6535)